MLKALRRLTKMTVNPDDFNVIKEGKASVLVPKEEKVFYNHIQQFNRDMSVMAIKAWLKWYNENKAAKLNKKRKLDTNNSTAVKEEQPKFVRILEALSASGLRALRYGHEIPQVSKIVANDLLPEAVESINRSAKYNNLENLVVGHQGDAVKYMGSISERERFHVVDLDPYGTAAPFLESAVLATQDNGLLMVTCTDAGVLAGNGYPEKCFALYGGSNFGNTFMKLDANHEAGIRLILSSIANVAAKHKKAIEPVLSLSIDYYFRVFVRITTSPIQVKQLASNIMTVYHCIGCGNSIEQRMGRVLGNKHQTPRMAPVGTECPYCQSPYHVAGPMWAGKLHDQQFVDDILQINSEAPTDTYGTVERIKGMLTIAKNEIETPFYVLLGQLPSLLKTLTIPIDKFANALGNLGHDVSLTHAKPNSVKTSAPWGDLLLVVARWLRRNNETRLAQLEKAIAESDNQEKNAAKQQTVDELRSNPDGSRNLTEHMPGLRVLKYLANDQREVDFDTVSAKSEGLVKLRKMKIVRFQESPANWGPKARPGK